MKATKTIITILLSVILIGFTYSLGYTEGNEDKENSLKIQDEIAQRYFDVIGNPATLSEQCKFECVVYGEKDCTYN